MPAELLALRHLASHAISQSTLAAKDAVFEAGSVAHEAHWLAQGSFEYVLNMSQRVGHQRWVSDTWDTLRYNQTWQWILIHYFWVIFLLKPPFIRGCSIAMFDYQRVGFECCFECCFG